MLELVDVHLLRRQFEDVSGGPVAEDHRPVGAGRGGQRPAQMGDMALQGGDGPPGRLVPPELLDEHGGGDDPAQPDQQEREQRSATWRAEGDVVAPVLGRHRPQNL